MDDLTKEILIGCERFKKLIESQLQRVEGLKSGVDFVDYSKKSKIILGFCGGDGIGPLIVEQARRVLECLLKNELESGKVKFKSIDGLAIENRAKLRQTLPEDVLNQINSCDVFLKGPTLTPRKGDGFPMLESANVALRRELDLFANVRPIKVNSKGIDWTFFRENTEDLYALGSNGLEIGPDLAFDFKVISKLATERIAKMAFDFAKRTGRKQVTVVTKANILKTTDGNFLQTCSEVAKKFPEIEFNDIYVDIATAKLIDEREQKNFSVFVLPNLYGDILTDEAAQIQGGVGTAGSANIGCCHAMFEAVHGCAPQMFVENRQQYADPSSIMRASAMMLEHVGFNQKANILNSVLDYCCFEQKNFKITGFDDGATTEQFTDYVLQTLQNL